MRNDFGSRPYKVRFPYKGGKTAKKQDTTTNSMNLQVQEMVKNLKALKIEETSLKVLKKQLAKERILLFQQWTNSRGLA